MSTNMIVEDDRKIFQILKDKLEKYGYSTVDVIHFERVVELFEQHQPIFSLLDWKVNGMLPS